MDKLKSYIQLWILLFSTLIMIDLYANSTKNIKPRNPFYSQSKIYTGTATPITEMTISHGFNTLFRGEIEYTAPPGTIFSGSIYDKNGKITKHGDILIKFDLKSRKKVIEFGNAQLRSKKAKLDYSRQKLNRYKNLYNKKAMKLASYQSAIADYYGSLSSFQEQEHRCWMNEYMMSKGTYYAQFDGIVDEVMMPSGWVAGELEIMRVSQLYPMGIKIKIDRKEANFIDNTVAVKIYPPLGGKPLGISHGDWRLVNDGIIVYVNNYPIKPVISPKDIGKDKSIIYKINTVILLNQNKSNSPLCVYTKCIYNDNKGSYVFKAIGQKNLSPNIGVANQFIIKKIYVEIGNHITCLDPGIKYISLKKHGDLKSMDVIIETETPSKLHDGEKIYYNKLRYVFMPGDPVKVEIGNTTQKP
jgi:hypothetical protein